MLSFHCFPNDICRSFERPSLPDINWSGSVHLSGNSRADATLGWKKLPIDHVTEATIWLIPDKRGLNCAYFDII